MQFPEVIFDFIIDYVRFTSLYLLFTRKTKIFAPWSVAVLSAPFVVFRRNSTVLIASCPTRFIHPSHAIFKRQQRIVGFTKTNIPFAKFIKKIEVAWERDVCSHFDHTHPDCKSVAAFYPRALAKNVTALHAEDQPVRFARFAQHAEPPGYILSDARPIAILRARLRLNRHHFNELLYRAGQQSDTPFCPSCSDLPESVDHVLLDCPRFLAQRQLLRDSLISCDLYGLAELGGLNRNQAIDVITGDLYVVPSSARATVLLATAKFLQAINAVRSI